MTAPGGCDKNSISINYTTPTRKKFQDLTFDLETAKNFDLKIDTESNRRAYFIRKLRKNLQYFIYGSRRLAHPKKYLDMVFLLGTTANRSKIEGVFEGVFHGKSEEFGNGSQVNLKNLMDRANITIDHFINGVGSNQQIESWSNSAARQALIFWAIVTYNGELVEFLWRKSDDPIAWGLGGFSILPIGCGILSSDWLTRSN